MKKFKVTIPLDYVQGHLRYGHLEAIVDAETAEEAEKMVKEAPLKHGWVEVDDYSIEDYGDFEFDNIEVEPYED